MATPIGDNLTSGQWLAVGQCLQSANGFFFALLQGNADFVLYWGELASGTAKWHAAFTSPGYPLVDPPRDSFMLQMDYYGNLDLTDLTIEADIWSSGNSSAEGSYSVVMQNDSNFCIYRDPGTPNSQLVWTPGPEIYDPVVSYELIDPGLWGPNTVAASDPTVIFTQQVSNNTDVTQTTTVVTQTITEQAPTWSDPSGLYPPFEVSFNEGSSTDVTVSLSPTSLPYDAYKDSAPSPPQTIWSCSVTVPPHSSVEVQVSATIFTITVPYNMNGKLIANSGNWVYKVIAGTYTETKHGDFNVTVAAPVPYPPPG